MRGHSLISLAAVGLLLAAGGIARAQEPAPANQGAEQNVRQSRQYEQLVCTNPSFRAKRIAQECGPITDPQLKQSCEASFQCDRPQRRSNKPPPSMTVR
jgi:hypothetical protein